jgi:hypothetical protein
MKTYTVLLTALGLLLTLTAGRAVAQAPTQYVRPSLRPPVSPYLSMFNAGQDPALNYFNLVRPPIDFRRSIYQLQSQNAAEEQAISALGKQPPLPTTGHSVGFQTQNRYFMTAGRAGTITGRPAGGTQSRAQYQPPAKR